MSWNCTCCCTVKAVFCCIWPCYTPPCCIKKPSHHKGPTIADECAIKVRSVSSGSLDSQNSQVKSKALVSYRKSIPRADSVEVETLPCKSELAARNAKPIDDIISHMAQDHLMEPRDFGDSLPGVVGNGYKA